MAAYTSTQTGNWSATATWGGSGPPAAGDTATIASGHTVTVDADTIVGATSGLSAPAVTINGTSSSVYGTLTVPSGVTLTLRGSANNTTGCAAKVNKYGLFQLQAGSTLKVGSPSDFGTIIHNQGRFEAIGTAGSRITLTAESVPSWSTAVTSAASTVYVMDRQGTPPLLSVPLGYAFVANAAGTGPGSFGDSSLTVNSSTPGCTTAKSSLAGIAGAGDYYVDHDSGIVYMYGSTFTGLAFNASYNRLDRTAGNWRGWGIASYGASVATDPHTLLIDYCDFSYMGAVSASATAANLSRRAPLNPDGHVCSTTDSARLFYCKNSTFSQCFRYIYVTACVGTSGDPLLITGNTFNEATGGTLFDGISTSGSYAQYVTVGSNTINSRGTIVDLTATYALTTNSTLSPDSNNWSVTDNTGFVGASLVVSRGPWPVDKDPDLSFGAKPSTPDLAISGNNIRGCGPTAAPDGRLLQVSGTSGHPCIVENNYFHHCNRLGHLTGSYVTFRENRFHQFYHHGFTGNVNDDYYVTDVRFENNLATCDRESGGSNSTSAMVALAYNHRGVINNVTVTGNTVDGGRYGVLDFNDIVDTAGGPLLATNIVCVNNIVSNGRYCYATAGTASAFTYAHVTECDFNNNYNPNVAMGTNFANNANLSGFYQGSSKYNRLASASRNIPGAALWDATYTANQTGGSARSLVYTVNTLGQDHTLAWGGGTAVQLIQDYGTSAGDGLRTIACTGKSWTSATTNIRAKWLWVRSGTGSGQARAIASGTANTAYAASVSAGGSGYSVGQYLTSTSGSPEMSKNVVLKVTSVNSGAVTGVSLISGGAFASVPSNPVSFIRATGTSGGSATFNLSWAPGLVLVPDLSTAVDSTSVFAIVNPQVTLTDSGGTDTVKAGLYLPDPSDPLNAVQIPTASQTDSGISVYVDKSPTGNPNFAGSGLSSVATDYQWASGAAQDSGTSDNAPATDYFGTARPQAGVMDMGFYELVSASASLFRRSLGSRTGSRGVAC